jgi:predicted amidohydrolase
MPVRARETTSTRLWQTATANRYGTERKGGETLTFIGTSEVCDPSGDILARGSEAADEICTVDVDPYAARDRAVNAYNDVFADRRPETYATESVEGAGRGA